MTVTTYCINRGTSSQYFGLVSVPENQVLYTQPSRGWKTEKGAVRWAEKHGYTIANSARRV